jgi:Na+/melibiose symporter-like transporter
MGSTVVSFWLMLLLGLMAWHMSKRPNAHPAHTRGEPSADVSVWLPFKREAFCRLLAVFVINGIASAIPATLVLFFIQDRLAADTSMEPVFLGIFFVCAALSMPGWVKLVTHFGLTKSWLMGMLLSVLVFIWASQLGRGDANAYFVICALSGFALGADLALPSAILAGVIARSGDLGQSQGAFFGWWNFATKLNLAFAAGIALPLLAWMGYVPGTQDPEALRYLTFAYCVLPCFLKLTASLGLYVLVIRAPDLFPTER